MTSLLINSIIYITLGILLQFVEVKSQTVKPGLRDTHTATFINDKLYILGGAVPPGVAKSPKETFLSLDFSAPFNTNVLKWIDLSSNNIVPAHYQAASGKGGANNNTLILYGGKSLNAETMALVYTFDTQSNLWRSQQITGTIPTAKQGITSVVDNNGLMYLFGGVVNGPPFYHTNDMYILDTINLNLKQASSINAPSPRILYGAVFLPNNNIIYMGGYSNNQDIPLTEVYLYDTVNDIWTMKVTSGQVPSARASFSSVLGLDGQRVIIFGERYGVNKTPPDSLYVLDINNFNWYIPKVSGKFPSTRGFSKAVLVGKYMVIAFGDGYTQETENDILLLDISNNNEYIWTSSSFEPSPPVSSSPAPSPSVPSSSTITTQPNTSTNTSTSNTAVNVGAVIGSLIGGILLTIGSFFLYRWYKNKKERNAAIPTSGNVRNNSPQIILQIPDERNVHYKSQQAISPSQIQPIHNHGQETTPNTTQNFDQNTLQSLVTELQAVKEEVNYLRSHQHNGNARNFNQGSE